MNKNSATDFKSLPSVDRLLNMPGLKIVAERYGHNSVLTEVRASLADLRRELLEKSAATQSLIENTDFIESLCSGIKSRVEKRFVTTMRPVFNLTGTVIHTNLGRSALPVEAIAAMTLAATQPVNLEFDLDNATRGDRDSHLEASLCEITGAEAATVVNNNAAAVLLVLNTLAAGREVPISRGELVEIGGSFRIPEVMQSAGCILKEVGTTNRTHKKDFEAAINANTGLLLTVHTSNYAIKGFTSAVSIAELAALARQHQLPLVMDLGSGTLVNLQQFGLPNEPTVSEVLQAGADLVTFSGDKLLGGPQAGIIAGKRELIARIKNNPLKRALRVDKIILAALLEVLYLYRDPQRLCQRLPTLRDLTRPLADIVALGESLLPQMQSQLQNLAEVSLQPCKSQIGSGALPLDLLESRALVLRPITEKGKSESALQDLADKLRHLPKPVLGRISDGMLWLDLRCLYTEEEFIAQIALLQD